MTTISRLDDFITASTTGATDSSGVTDYTDAILAWLADARVTPYREMVWTPGRVYGYQGGVGGSKHLYVPSHTRMIGWGATLKAMLTAGPTTAGLLYTDPGTMGLAAGPVGFTLDGLTIDQRAPARRAAGVIASNLPQENAAVYMISCQDFEVSNVHTVDTGADGIYVGGDDRYGYYSMNGLIRRCKADNPGRNCFSIVGAYRVHGEYNQALNASFGRVSVGTGGLSDGYDFEPDGTHTQNTDCIWSYCLADNCKDDGFASRPGNARVLWHAPNATNCGIGYYSISPTTPFQTKLVMGRYGGNTTNFSGIAESIAGF